MEKNDISKSPSDLLTELKRLDDNELELAIRSMCSEEIIDVLELLESKLIPGNKNQDYKISKELYIYLWLSRKELFKAYFSGIFPWRIIWGSVSCMCSWDFEVHVVNPSLPETSENYCIEKYVLFTKVSIPKLRQINNQLKLWWVAKGVVSSVSEFNKAQLSLLEMQKQFESIDESTLKNPLVMQEIIKIEKIIEELLLWLSEKKDFFNSDLWPLVEKMWWHLHYSWKSRFGSLQIRDKENNVVNIWGKFNVFEKYTCVYSSDPETIALSEKLGWITLKFIDKEKNGQKITWQHPDIEAWEMYYDYIDPVMYDLVNTILKKWFSWRISIFQDKYFVLSDNSWCVFFDNKWNELSDEEWTTEFNATFDYEIVDWKVITKGLKKADKSMRDRFIFQVRRHRDKPWND